MITSAPLWPCRSFPYFVIPNPVPSPAASGRREIVANGGEGSAFHFCGLLFISAACFSFLRPAFHFCGLLFISAACSSLLGRPSFLG
jgi:hypothetical protein